MALPNKTAFTVDDLSGWVARARLSCPEPPTTAECLTCKSVDSFDGKAMRTGIVFRMALDDGETVTVRLNPFIALEMLNTIVQSGIGQGWTDGNGHITFPITET
ncbi:MAG: hypothetical protein V4747_11375 [Pseudomonadota bacterium]